ncbi:MAG TPA: MFS transporter [Trebonia sp.]
MTEDTAGSRPRSYPKGVRRRQQILDSLVALLGQRGVDRASLRSVGQAIGVSHTALRHYFSSRDELLVEAYRTHEARAAGAVPATDPSAVGLIVEAAERNRSIPGLVELYATLTTDALQEQHAVTREFVRDRFRSLRAELAARVESAQRAGTVAADIDPADAAALVIAASDGLQIQWLLDPGTVDVGRSLAILERLLPPGTGPDPAVLPSTGRFPAEGRSMTDAALTSGGPPLARRRWSVTAAFGLGGITVAAWGPRLPAIKAELNVGTATIGLLLAGITVGSILGLLASTPVRHWAGGRRAVLGAAGLIAAAMTVMGVALIAGSIPLLAVAFVITGTGVGLLDVLINVEGAAVERSAGRTLMPGMHAAWSIGAAVGSGIGAACAALDVTPAAQLIGEAVFIAVAACGTAPGIPPGEREPAGRPPRQDRGTQLRQWLRGWLDGRLLLIGLVMLGVELGEGSANSWLTLAVRNNHGQTPAVAALFFTVFAVTEGLTRIFAGPVVDRLGRVLAIRVTTAVGVAGIALFILAGDRWLVLLGVVLWAFGVSLGFPLGTSAAAQSGPNAVARISVVSSIGYFANFAGPPAIGTLAQSAGLLRSLWLIGALFIAAFAAAGSLAPRPAVPEPAVTADR